MNDTQTVQKPLAELWKKGYVKVESVFNPQEIGDLARECKALLESESRPWPERKNYKQTAYRMPVFVDKDWSVLMNLIGASPRVDTILEKMFMHPLIKALLEPVIGTGYKAWEISVRRAHTTDEGLRLHQDAIGEFGLSVLLTDNLSDTGTTVFVEGSHRYPITAREAGMDYIPPKYLKRFVKPASGRAGDIFIFFKKTWHGRLPSASATPGDAILLSLFPVGYDFLPFDVPSELTQSLPPELSRLLDTEQNLRPLESGRYQVTGPLQRDRIIDKLYQEKRRFHPGRLFKLLKIMMRGIHGILLFKRSVFRGH